MKRAIQEEGALLSRPMLKLATTKNDNESIFKAKEGKSSKIAAASPKSFTAPVFVSDGVMKTVKEEDVPVQGACRSVGDFDKICRIGEGTYGTVYKALDKNTNSHVALKRVLLHNEREDGFPITSLREIATLRKVSGHPNIVSLLDVVASQKKDGVFLVFEYCEHDMSVLLNSVPRDKNLFSESEFKALFRGLVSAVEHLHSMWIIHRDIKMSNILYTNSGFLKLADFGLARTTTHRVEREGEKLTPGVCTLWYRAPEVLLGETHYTSAIDMWSLGCVFAELQGRGPLLQGKNEMEQLNIIYRLLGAPHEGVWPGVGLLPLVANNVVDLRKECEKFPYNELKDSCPRICDDGVDLMHMLLTYCPKQRILAKKAKRHRYFEAKPYYKDEDEMPFFKSGHSK